MSIWSQALRAFNRTANILMVAVPGHSNKRGVFIHRRKSDCPYLLTNKINYFPVLA